MGVWDLAKRLVPGVAVLGATATGAGVLFFSPVGPLQPRPERCPEHQTCVLVAVLDRDVNIGFGVGDQPFGFDIDDQMTRRTVAWLTRPDEDNIQVFKLPEEIVIPELGLRNSRQARAQTVAHARDLGHQYNATLVVIGEVNDGSVDLDFINPNNTSQTLKPVSYAVSGVDAPPHLIENFQAALASAQGLRPSETNVAAGDAATSDSAIAMPIDASSLEGAGATTPDATGEVRQANISSEDRVQLTRLISGLLDNYQQGFGAFTAAPGFEDEIVPLQPGSADRWSVSLAGGVAYSIIGACDNECNNVDIELYDSSGALVARDVLADDYPIVQVTPPSQGTYVVRTILRTCTLAPCFVGARVLVPGQAGGNGGGKP